MALFCGQGVEGRSWHSEGNLLLPYQPQTVGDVEACLKIDVSTSPWKVVILQLGDRLGPQFTCSSFTFYLLLVSDASSYLQWWLNQGLIMAAMLSWTCSTQFCTMEACLVKWWYFHALV